MRPRTSALALLFCASAIISAQVQTLAPGLRKLGGTESTSRITYARIFLDGTRVPTNSPPNAEPFED